MSKSMARVRRALEEAGLAADIHALGEARTAAQAAAVAGCAIDQIAKSIIFAGLETGRAVLFLTAGGNQVEPARASAVAGEALGKAGADLIRAQTGFAIGGVAPVGHLTPIRAYMDPRLMEFDVIWAAAGTPQHIFPITPADLHRLTGAEQADFTA
jgi:prolyl-tRNA editing enzyme YbaK/EbsC (Cys-tRNA(Pro) deacylase)